MLRTVADDTPSPLSWASRCDATGSPVSMYSRTSVASSRRERSESSKEPITCQLPFLKGAVPAHRHGGHVGLGDLAVFHGDQLGEDADGDFLRSNRADVETDRGVHALEPVRLEAFPEQLVVNALYLRLAADQAEVAKGSCRQRAQRVEVVSMAAGHDHRVRRRRQLVRGDPVGNLVDLNVDPLAKPFRAGEFLAV